MLTVSCPTCESTLRLGDELLGQQVRCGGCQEVFVAEGPLPPPKRSRRDDDDEDRPRKRPSRRDDDYDDDRDRPTRRRSRRDDDIYDDEYDDDDRPRKRKKRRMKKVAPGKPGLAVAAAILFLIWGGVGAILSILSIVGLTTLLDSGAPATAILSGLVQVILSGCFAAYLIVSGLKILNGQAEDLTGIGTAVLSLCGFVLILSVVRVALLAPAFALSVALIAAVTVLVIMSGVIVGSIFCIVASAAYDKWQAS